jgi:hypothetical protein
MHNTGALKALWKLISLLSHRVPSTYSLITESYVLIYQPLCHSCSHLVTIFRRVRKIAKTNYYLRRVCLSVRPQWNNSAPTGGF